MKIEILLLSLLIIFSPLYVVRFKVFSVPTTLLEALILFCILVWLISKFKQFPKKLSVSKLFTFEYGFILWLLAASTMALFVTRDFWGALGIYKAYIIEPIIIYLIIGEVIKRRNSANWIIWAYVISAIWISMLAIIQIVTGKFTLAPNELAVGRATAVYNSANAIGLYLGPIFFLALSQIKKGISNFFVQISLILIIVAIILSKSEGALVSLVSVIFVMLLTLKLKFKYVLIPIISTIFLISLVILFTNHFSNLFTPQISDSSYAGTNTLQIRAYLWKGTSSLLSDHSLFGAGLNGFKTEYFNNYKLAQYDEALQYPHNMILNFWTELGFGGAVWIIGIYAYLLYKLRDSKIEDNNNNQFRFFILMAFLYSFIHGLVDVPFFKNDLSLQFWILLALAKTEEKHFMDSSKRRD